MLTCEHGNRVHACPEVHVAFVDGLHDAVCRQDSLSSAGIDRAAVTLCGKAKRRQGPLQGPIASLQPTQCRPGKRGSNWQVRACRQGSSRVVALVQGACEGGCL